MEVLEEEIFHLTKELKTKEEQNKEVTKEYRSLQSVLSLNNSKKNLPLL
ncbi:hypothetical protein Golax_010397 [Gossypium laxum]|uniref:Uncharacterized protein n=1 Tax=Gossypium laxum TaxID=34288 RepID=A0A7J8ZHK3_9ROSI|nr:hypothetical protein [Gossypium laxum]